MTSIDVRPATASARRSWRRTYHRTMTQEASERSVAAPFDGRELDWLGVLSRPRRTADEYQRLLRSRCFTEGETSREKTWRQEPEGYGAARDGRQRGGELQSLPTL
ncbi:MAG: hypothetical protein HC897_13660 [Thermoanaerobaculia bacterium]|nr:hypothetical protein [Thermoanaerobaculia bacterium]